MRVYGDVVSACVEPAGLAARVLDHIRRSGELPVGRARHEKLVRALILAGELAQGIADAEMAETGADTLTPLQVQLARVLRTLAVAIDASWHGNPRAGALPETALSDLPGTVRRFGPVLVKRAEGHALYAVYPEAYAAAARRSGLDADCLVIGIRSIGCTLAPMVAAAVNAAAPSTVRPVGDPFRRRIAAGADLSRWLAARKGGSLAIVDEGPGLSGSSFAAVASWAEQCGFAPGRIHFFPSHSGVPGPEADAAIRDRWTRTTCHPAEGTGIIARIEAWLPELTGPLEQPLEDLSAGGWRRHRPTCDGGILPAHPGMERLKFLAHTAQGAFLLKFAGLGDDGPRKLATASRLADAGFSPEPLGLCHGFLVTRWVEGGGTGALADRGRLEFLNRVGDYLGFRSRHLPCKTIGAPVDALFDMARSNVAEALGEAAAGRLRLPPSAGAMVRRVSTDNRMHLFEWIRTTDGRLIKTDATDHDAGHDMIGSQDIAWDVGGALVEYDLDEEELTALCNRVRSISGHPVHRELVDVMATFYAAFQLGLWTLAETSHPGSGGGAMAERYADWLARRLA
jgi:hypothetical protein